ncbi:MAG: CDP-archaeol synthase [Pseudomonadota bacterium]
MRLDIISELVLLLVIANGAPLLAGMLFGRWLNTPLDGNRRLGDGHPVLGPAKTVRGLVASVLACTLAAPVFGLAPGQGALFGMLAMSGDLLSSFSKRRLGITTSHSAPLLDQLPEALLPLLVMQSQFGAGFFETSMAILVFTIIDLLYSRLRDANGEE